MELPKISIVTVCYNAADLLPKTIDSVLEQSYPNIEYIVIDGASKDDSLSVLKKYGQTISILVSEPDKGIYDAMNKALDLAKGEYVWFLNAGDSIYSKNTLTRIFEGKVSYADIYYGETMIVNSQGQEVGLRRLRAPEKLSWKSFKWGMLVCHQSILIKRNLIEKFDRQYKCSADYDCVLKALKKAKKIQNTHLIVANFLQGGKSREMMVLSWRERFKIMCKQYGWVSTLFFHILIFLRLFYHWIRDRRV